MRDMGAADVALLSHLPLGQGLFPVQAVAQCQYLLLPFVQDLPMYCRTVARPPAADRSNMSSSWQTTSIRDRAVPSLPVFDVVGQGDVRSAFRWLRKCMRISFSTHRAAWWPAGCLCLRQKVDTALMSPMVPMDMRSSWSEVWA